MRAEKVAGFRSCNLTSHYDPDNAQRLFRFLPASRTNEQRVLGKREQGATGSI